MNGSKSLPHPRSPVKQWAQQIQEEGMLPDDPDDTLVKDSEDNDIEQHQNPQEGRLT